MTLLSYFLFWEIFLNTIIVPSDKIWFNIFPKESTFPIDEMLYIVVGDLSGYLSEIYIYHDLYEMYFIKNTFWSTGIRFFGCSEAKHKHDFGCDKDKQNVDVKDKSDKKIQVWWWRINSFFFDVKIAIL